MITKTTKSERASERHEILFIFVKRGQGATPYLLLQPHTPTSTHASALGLTEAFIQPSQASTQAKMKLSIEVSSFYQVSELN